MYNLTRDVSFVEAGQMVQTDEDSKFDMPDE